jgi:diguanylate cyclase (GGDEF)-like protein/PAS domain S-box-containing protein
MSPVKGDQNKHGLSKLGEASLTALEGGDHLPAVVFKLHGAPDGAVHFISVNERIRDMCESTPEDAYHADSCFAERLHPEDYDQVMASLHRSRNTLDVWHSEHRIKLPKGGVRWHELRAQPTPLRDGSVVWHGIIVDITERKQVEERLRLEAAAFESQQGFVITDARGMIVRVNNCFTEITGHANVDVLGKPSSILLSSRENPELVGRVMTQVLDQGFWHGESTLRGSDGNDIPCQITVTAVQDHAGRMTHFIGAFSDISARKEAERQIHELAFYDPLTKLANRRLLMDRLAKAMANSRRSRQYGAILYIDLDHFKTLNDTLGHDYGDQLLQEVARRLAAQLRDGDSVARLGGDEFVVLVSSLGGDRRAAETNARSVADKILETLRKPYSLPNLSTGAYHSTASIGVCLYLDHEEPIDTLLKYADIALYQAKNSGRCCVRFYGSGAEARHASDWPINDPLVRAENLITQAIQILDENIYSPPPVADLAKRIGTNARKLTLLFRKKFGLTVTQYGAELRLELARRLLAETDHQIQLIGERIGYVNAGDFSRAFSRRYGQSPRQYRQQHGKQESPG